MIVLADTYEISIQCAEDDGLSENSPNIKLLGGLLVALAVLWASSACVNGIFFVEPQEIAHGPNAGKSDGDNGELTGWSKLSS